MTEQPMPEDIQACAFFLADHAVVENGKLYVNGGFWNQVYAFAVTFEDADGRPLTARFEGQFRVGTAPNMRVGDFTVMPVAALVTNFILDRPGDYSALLEVNGAELARWRFRAIETSDATGGTQAGAGSGPLPEEP